MLVKVSWQCPEHSNYWTNVGYVWIWALVLLINSMVWMLTLWFWKVYKRSEVFIGYTKSCLCEERRFMAGVRNEANKAQLLTKIKCYWCCGRQRINNVLNTFKSVTQVLLYYFQHTKSWCYKHFTNSIYCNFKEIGKFNSISDIIHTEVGGVGSSKI